MSGTYYKNSYCKFCKKHFKTINGKNGHEPYCIKNPNKKNAWNKGLDISDDRVKKNTERMKKTKNTEEYKNTYPAWNKGLDISDDRVKKNAEGQKKTKSLKEWKESHKDRIKKKYNGKHFTQTKEYIKNREETHFKKYGVRHSTQRPEIYKKILEKRYLLKEYILPSGNVIKLQGYEPFALDYLLNVKNYNETDIITEAEKMPYIFYILKGAKHRYFPDIFLENENKIIEIKSDFTMEQNKEKNKMKHYGTKKLGFVHEFWVFNRQGILLKKIGDYDEYFKLK